jgi:flagellar basal body-associated protein FliL
METEPTTSNKKKFLIIALGAVLVFLVTMGVAFLLTQQKLARQADLQGEVRSTPPEEKIYPEVEKVNILQDLAGVKATTTATVKETQKRIQVLKEVSSPVDTTTSDEEKLRILNSLGGATQ